MVAMNDEDVFHCDPGTIEVLHFPDWPQSSVTTTYAHYEILRLLNGRNLPVSWLSLHTLVSA